MVFAFSCPCLLVILLFTVLVFCLDSSTQSTVIGSFNCFSFKLGTYGPWPWTRAMCTEHTCSRAVLVKKHCMTMLFANTAHGHRCQLEMWANAQRDGRPAEYRWRPLFNATVWLTPTSRVPCSNAAKTRNPLKFAGVPKLKKRSQPPVDRSSLYCKDMWRRYCCLTSFFSDCRYVP